MAGRALLTDRDREVLQGEPSEDQYTRRSKIKARIRDRLPRDLEILREHHPEAFEQLTEVVDESQN